MIKMFGEGRLTKDAEVFKYGDGKSGISFTIASNDRGSEEADFLSCTIFGRDENLAQYLKMGNQVIVEGRYKKNDKGYVSCIVDDFKFGANKQS